VVFARHVKAGFGVFLLFFFVVSVFLFYGFLVQLKLQRPHFEAQFPCGVLIVTDE